MEAESLSGARTVNCLEWRVNTPMTSINQLPLSVLQLAYDFGIGLEIALIAFYSSVQLAEPVSCVKQTYFCSPTPLPSRSLASFLGGGLVIGSIIASMQWFALQGYTIPLTGMVPIMLVVLLAAVFLKPRRNRSSHHDTSDLCPNLLEKPMSNLDELPEAPPPQDLRTLQQQNWLPIELSQAPTFQDGDLKAVIQEITAATTDTLTISYRIRRHTKDDISCEGSTIGIGPLDRNILSDIVTVPDNLIKHQQPEPVTPKANLNPLDSELRLYRTSLLFKLTNQIRSSLEADTILETAVESIRNLLHIDRCHVIWYRPDEIAPSWEVVNEAKTSLVKSHIGSYSIERLGLLGEQMLKGKTLKIDDVETLCNFDLQESLLSLGYKSLLSIPIETKQGEIGAINCIHCSRYRLWEDSEVELLQALVEQLAIALDQATLYEQARQAAAEAKAQTKQLKLTLNQLKTAQSQLVQNAKMSSLGQLVAGIAH
ncbi:MAG TPA: GAF domain-containing protein, partial [Coleofasciculaceae cyanobacterium]